MHESHFLDERRLSWILEWLRLLANDTSTDLCVGLQDVLHKLVSLLKKHLFCLLWLTLKEENHFVVPPVHGLVNCVLEDVLVFNQILVLLL
jgi:hypothetical protein